MIKPSNLINPLIPGIMAMWPTARALFLHAPLDAYLASIARKGMWGRLWVRDLFGKLLREGMVNLGVAPSDYLGLTDIQVAALGWLTQHAQFQALTKQLGERVLTLNSETLIAHPADSLTALARHFDITLSRADIADIVSGPIFGRDSKTGADFAQGQRVRAAQDGKALHAEEVEKVGEWATLIARNNGIVMDLPRPLLD
ncbi:Sulfotransferase family protein OS=Sphingobium scionense OX=1404341 GN=GGQ90_004196 PE=4 SV=1 [Sphingobium scionense]